jgi:signal transduction histidine kinase
MQAKKNPNLMKLLRKRFWSFLGSSPLWLKIMGTVLFPLFLVLLVLLFYGRQYENVIFSSQNNPLILTALLSSLTNQALLVIGVTIVVGIGLAYLLSRILVRPVNQLLTVMQRVKQGDLAARVEVWAQDEIGQVQVAFDEITANLETAQRELVNQNQELAAVNEFSEALSLGKGADSIVEIALNRVVSLMKADVGSIYLLEKGSNTLRLKASQGYLSPVLIQAMSSAGMDNPLLRCLIETGHPMAIGDVSQEAGKLEDLAPLLSHEGYLSWACALLKMEGEAIGVYQLGKYEKRSFSSYDLALLEIVGNVVGSSISNAQLLKDLRRKEWELRRALHRSVDLQEDERKRLARELHDEIGQALTSILIRLKTLQGETDPDVIVSRLDDLRELTSQTIEELRRISMDLRPAALDNLGIIPALRWYMKQSSELTGIPIQFNGPDKSDRLSPEIELILYRVAQEGITNAIRHGKAEKIEITLERYPRAIRLIVADNGKGFNPTLRDQGLGLIGIRERVELLDGRFQVKASPGAGTQLWIEIPLKR